MYITCLPHGTCSTDSLNVILTTPFCLTARPPIGQQNVAVNATVNNYAKAAFEEISGGGAWTQNGNNYALTYNVGPGGGSATFDLGIVNAVTGPSDLLSGSFATSASGVFSLSGLGSLSGLAAGQADTQPVVNFTSGAAGTYRETLTLNATGSNASGYVGVLAPETLTITVNVGQNYALTTRADTITGGAGNNLITATAGTLNAKDVIDGGVGGFNVLALNGAGSYNLALPQTLVDISKITAKEGQAAYKPANGSVDIASTRQTIYLRDGLNAALDVASDTAVNTQDPNAAGITIYGANNSATINLGSGNDTVYLGSSAETVNGGVGSNSYHVTATTIGATINGISGEDSLYISGGGSMVMGRNITGIENVYLQNPAAGVVQPDYTFVANATKGLIINGSAYNDTITAGDVSQTINGAAGNDRIIVNAITAGALVHGGSGTNTLEITGGGVAVMNSSDTSLQYIQLDAATDLTLSNQNSMTIEGSGGNDAFNIGTGSDTFVGGNGNEDYVFGSRFGQDVINNVASSGSGMAHGQIDFLSGITDQNLWFRQTGNDLEIDHLGTTQKITVSNWFGGNNSAQVQRFNAGGLALDSQVSQLVAAMASYAASNASFNPATAHTMPTNTALQATIAASWHH